MLLFQLYLGCCCGLQFSQLLLQVCQLFLLLVQQGLHLLLILLGSKLLHCLDLQFRAARMEMFKYACCSRHVFLVWLDVHL